MFSSHAWEPMKQRRPVQALPPCWDNVECFLQLGGEILVYAGRNSALVAVGVLVTSGPRLLR